MAAVSLKQTLRRYLPKSFLDAYVWLKHIGKKLPDHELYTRHVAQKMGIEVGGPSIVFRTVLPLYQTVRDLDGVNFSNQTIWEGKLVCGRSFNYLGSRKGQQFISDATDLSQIKSDTYDFLLSSNCLEHVANPLKALLEWKRVIKAGSALVLVLPNKISNFDHNRPVTSFEHILDDLTNDTPEHDLTHLDEILALHDLTRDRAAGNVETFRKRSLDNFNNRGLHHHVFDISLIKMMLSHVGFEVIHTTETRTDFFALAKKKF